MPFSWNGNNLNRPDQISDPHKAGIVAANPDPACQILDSQPKGRAPERVGTLANWFKLVFPIVTALVIGGGVTMLYAATLFGPLARFWTDLGLE